ncbi:MAG: hypothetical protein ACE5J3_08350, partial [Methanosarcinales archaeon]
MDKENLIALISEVLVQRNWKFKLAKKREGEQSLFIHSLNELGVIHTLIDMVKDPPPSGFGLTENEQFSLILGAVGHDVGKEKEEWQRYILGMEPKVSHIDEQLARDIVNILKQKLRLSGTYEDAISGILLHMKGGRTQSRLGIEVFKEHESERFKMVADIIAFVDNIISATNILSALEVINKKENKDFFGKYIVFEYHKVSIIRGISTI